MSPTMIFGLIVMSGVLSYGLFTAFLQLTIRQYVMLVWSIAAGVGLYAAYESSVLDRPLWVLAHVWEPADQTRLAWGGPAPGMCSFTGVIDDWQGRVQTALGPVAATSQYLRIEAGPSMVLTNAPQFDATTPRPATPADPGAASALSAGDEVLVSGAVTDQNGMCSASYARDGIATLLLAPTRLRRADSLPIPAWALLGVGWLVLVAPAAAMARWVEPQRPEPKERKVMRSISAPKNAVSPGIAGLDIAALMAAHRRAAAAGDTEAARSVAEQLEGARAEKHEDWLALSAFFQSEKRVVSERIVTERYLTTNEDNAAGQIRLAQILDAGKQDRRRVAAMTAALAARADLTPGQMLELGALFAGIRDRPAAIALYRRLLDEDRDSLEGRSRLLGLLVDQPDKAVDQMLAEFRAMIPDVEFWYVTCADYASRRKNTTLFHECTAHVRARVQGVDVYWNRRLVDAHIRMGEREAAEQIYVDVDYATITSEVVCKRLLDVAEHYGFSQAALVACSRLLELAPSEPLRAKIRSLSLLSASGPVG